MVHCYYFQDWLHNWSSTPCQCISSTCSRLFKSLPSSQPAIDFLEGSNSHKFHNQNAAVATHFHHCCWRLHHSISISARQLSTCLFDINVLQCQFGWSQHSLILAFCRWCDFAKCWWTPKSLKITKDCQRSLLIDVDGLTAGFLLIKSRWESVGVTLCSPSTIPFSQFCFLWLHRPPMSVQFHLEMCLENWCPKSLASFFWHFVPSAMPCTNVDSNLLTW